MFVKMFGWEGHPIIAAPSLSSLDFFSYLCISCTLPPPLSLPSLLAPSPAGCLPYFIHLLLTFVIMQIFLSFLFLNFLQYRKRYFWRAGKAITWHPPSDRRLSSLDLFLMPPPYVNVTSAMSMSFTLSVKTKIDQILGLAMPLSMPHIQFYPSCFLKKLGDFCVDFLW